MAKLLQSETEALIAEQSAIDTKIATLETKAGADAFILARKQELEAVMPKDIIAATRPGRMSMSELLAIELEKVTTQPEEAVSQELAKLSTMKIAANIKLETLAAEDIEIREG